MFTSDVLWSSSPVCHIDFSLPVLFQQSDVTQKRGQLLWRNSVTDINHSGSHQIILLQQPGLLPATFQLSKPLSRKFNVSERKIPGSYLPILNSYPRIVPHPSKKPLDKYSIHESQSLSKRVCSEQKTDGPSVTRNLPEQHLHKQPKLALSATGMPCSSPPQDQLSASSPTPTSMSQRSPSVSSQDTSYSLFTTSSAGLNRDATTSIRHRRFLNTVKILSPVCWTLHCAQRS